MKQFIIIITTLLFIVALVCCSSDYDNIGEPGIHSFAVCTRSMANEVPDNVNNEVMAEIDTVSDTVLWYPPIDSTFVYNDNIDFTLSLHVTSRGGTFETIFMSCNPIVQLKNNGQYDSFRLGAQTIYSVADKSYISGCVIFIKNNDNINIYETFTYDSTVNHNPIKIPNPQKKK